MITRRQQFGLALYSVIAIGILLLGLVAGTTPAVQAQGPNFRDPIVCDASAVVTMATATTTEMVGLTSGQRIVVCGFVLSGGGANTAKFIRGTGTNCAGAAADVTAPFELADNTSVAYGGGVGTVFRLPAATALCITTSQAVQLSGVITYAKF